MSQRLQTTLTQRGAATVMIVVILLLLISGALITLFSGVQSATVDTVSGRERLQALMLAEAGLANARNRFLNGESCDTTNFTAPPIAVGTAGSFSFLNVQVTGSMSCIFTVQGQTAQGSTRVLEANIFKPATPTNQQTFTCISPPKGSSAFLVNVNWETRKSNHPDVVSIELTINGSKYLYMPSNSRFLKAATNSSGTNMQISTQQILIIAPNVEYGTDLITGEVHYSSSLSGAWGTGGNGVACLTLENVDPAQPIVQDFEPRAGYSDATNFSITPLSSSSMIVDSLVKEGNHEPVMSEWQGRRELMWMHNQTAPGSGSGSAVKGATGGTMVPLNWSFYNKNTNGSIAKSWAQRAVEIRAANATSRSVNYRKFPRDTGASPFWREVAVSPPS